MGILFYPLLPNPGILEVSIGSDDLLSTCCSLGMDLSTPGEDFPPLDSSD
jgi:hypothetical protein